MPSPIDPPSESAASRVFHVPELFSLIVHDLTSAELSQAARVTEAAAAECERLLYRSKSVTGFGKGDNRPWSRCSGSGAGRARWSVSRSHAPDAFPTK